MSDLPATFVSGFHDEHEVRKMKYNDFGNTGLKVSQISLGTGGFSDLYGDYLLEECKKTVHGALKSGINYIDTAYWYGQNVSQEILGKCLKGIPRKAYYLATKVGRYEKDAERMFDFSAEKTKWSIQNSLQTMGVEYIDVLQIHDIEFAPSLEYLFKETLPVLQDAVQKGVIKFIGISGYPLSVLENFIKKCHVKLDMVLSYSRLTLFDDSLKKYLPYFKNQKLGVVNAAGLGMGLLTNVGPQPWHPAHEETKAICTEAREYCKSKNVELAKLSMYYLYQEDGPDTQLVGMNSKKLLEEHLDVLLNGISAHEKDVLKYVTERIFPKLQNRDWEALVTIK